MIDSHTIRPDRAHPQKCTVRPDKNQRSATYNYTEMKRETVFASEGFSGRLISLRSSRDISAREMSLSLGQAAGYINNIENGNNLPSMSMFFEICEYLKVSPKEFFEYTVTAETLDDDLAEALSTLSIEDKELLLRIARKLKR